MKPLALIFIIITLIAPVFCKDGEYPSKCKVTHKVYFDISIGGVPKGVIVFGLFNNTAPIAATNFFHLANETFGYGYINSTFHRVIPWFMIQGGKFTQKNGGGSRTIYGDPGTFDDENFKILNAPGCLGMANAGPNTNRSQFYISTVFTPWLDGKHVVFGRVLEGMGVVLKIGFQPRDENDKPKKDVVITDCGILELNEAELSDTKHYLC